jgi:hypothetical protein
MCMYRRMSMPVCACQLECLRFPAGAGACACTVAALQMHARACVCICLRRLICACMRVYACACACVGVRAVACVCASAGVDMRVHDPRQAHVDRQVGARAGACAWPCAYSLFCAGEHVPVHAPALCMVGVHLHAQTCYRVRMCMCIFECARACARQSVDCGLARALRPTRTCSKGHALDMQ